MVSGCRPGTAETLLLITLSQNLGGQANDSSTLPDHVRALVPV